MIRQNDQINDLNEDTGAIALVSKPTNGLFLQRWFREADRRIPTPNRDNGDGTTTTMKMKMRVTVRLWQAPFYDMPGETISERY